MVQNIPGGQQPQRRNPQRPNLPASGPTQEEIQLRAFQIYEARGRAPSQDLEDWVQAERELRNDV